MPKPKLTCIILALAGLLFAAGCQLWNPGGTTYTDAKGKFTVRAPDGWKYATKLGADFLASKDGPILQQIWIEHRELKAGLPNSKKPLAANANEFELGEAIVGDLQADHALQALEVKDNVPALVGGKNGVKITFAYRTAEKLRLSETLYAAIHDGHLWLIRYRAPARHYFDRDLPVFEQTANSFRFSKI